MRRFNKNSKFKRVISMFLACWTFILTLLSSFCVDEISLSADSNDRRMQYIQIANGKRLTDIENYNEIDADSLRAVALYLSNFYVPFSTVLDEDYQNEDNDFRKNMLSALVDSCGVEEDTANFMVNNTIEQTLKSCKQIYVEYDYVKFVNEYLYWRQEALSYGFCLCNNGDKNFDCTATGSIHDRKSLGTGYTMIRDSISYYNKAGIRPTVGFAGNKIYSKTVGSTKEGGLELNPYSHAQFMSKVSSMTSADSEGSTDLKNIGGIAYEPLTYPVFLSLMNFGYNNAILEALPANIRCLVGYGRESVDKTVANNLIEQMELMTNQAGLSYDEGKKSSPLVWGWDKIDESFFDHYYRKVDGKGDNKDTYRVRCMNFVWFDDSSGKEVAKPCFSNSMDCIRAYAMVMDRLNYSNGIGSGFVSVTPEEFATIDPSLQLCATVLCSTMYVDWVGDIIINDGIKRYLMFPGCANPYSLGEIAEGQTNLHKGFYSKEDAEKFKEVYNSSYVGINKSNILELNSNDLVDNSDCDDKLLVDTDKTRDGFSDTIPLCNIYALSRYKLGLITKTSYKRDYNYNYYMAGYDGDGSLFNLYYWRERYGSDSTDFDNSKDWFISSWGENEDLFNALDKFTFKAGEKEKEIVNIVDKNGDDKFTFPSWAEVLNNPFLTSSSIGSIKNYRWICDASFSFNNTSNIIFDLSNFDIENSTRKNIVVSDGIKVEKKDLVEGDNQFEYLCWWCNGLTDEDGVAGGKTGVYLDKSNVEDLLSKRTAQSRGLDQIAVYDSAKGLQGDESFGDLFKTDNIFDVYSVSAVKSVNFLNITKFNYTTEATKFKDFYNPLFITYALAYFNADSTKYNEDENVINLRFNKEGLPKAGDSLDFSKLPTSSTTQDKVLSFIYWFLHPVEGVKYVATWFKNKIAGILIGWHEDVVGSSDSNSTTGMTKYLGFSGYVTTPSLYDINWMANLLDMYNSIIVYLIIIMSVILLAYVLIGTMTIQRGILGFFIFALLAFIPPIAINTTTEVINETCNSIYSTKFDYWAICQTEQYISLLNTVNTTEDSSEYTAMLMKLNSGGQEVGAESETSYSGVRVKWICPKKFNSLAALGEAMKNSSLANTDATFLRGMFVNSIAKQVSGETFVDSQNALYLYRDMLDIYKYASCSYNLYTTFNLDGALSNSTYKSILKNQGLYIGSKTQTSDCTATSNWVSYIAGGSTSLPKIKYSSGQNMAPYIEANLSETGRNPSVTVHEAIEETSSLKAMRKGFLFKTLSGSVNCYYTQNTLAPSLLINFSRTAFDVKSGLNRFEKDLEKKSIKITLDNIKNDSIIYGLPANTFSFAIQELMGLKDTNASPYKIPGTKNDYTLQNIPQSITTENKLDSFYYGLYSESPFYYFNYNIRDQLVASNTGYNFDYENLTESRGSLKNLFLGNNQGYFYNLTDKSGDGYGELRDFMNFHDLFYYIIPSLRAGVDLAREFDDVYSIKIYDDCNLKFKDDGTVTYDGKEIDIHSPGFETVWNGMSDEERYKFWHDYNVNTILSGYTPWLDTMMDCSYSESETIMIAGKSFLVKNPLDPTSYFKIDNNGKMSDGRYMVFSRSEMAYYGLKLSDLTTVERKLIEIQDNVYAETLDLMNYYTFSDESLIQAYAMIQLFEFNKAFSQTSYFGDNNILYPQSYELKAFTYDAYLRLIIAGSSGDDLMTDSDGTGNQSIYERVIKKTSLFFGLVLLVNDFIAVYLIPALKLFFLMIIFFLSIFIIVASAIKLEFNFITVMWKSLLAPLLSFGLTSIGMAWVVSLFMSNGADGVVSSSLVIDMGDPTMALIVMVIINVVVLILYWKICKKCWKDGMKFLQAIVASVSGALVGATSKIFGAATMGKITGNQISRKLSKGGYGYSTPQQRASDYDVKTGKRGLGFGGAAVGALAGAGASKALEAGGSGGDGQTSGSSKENKYDKKIESLNNKANKSMAKSDQKLNVFDDKISRAEEAGNTRRAEKLKAKKEKLENKANQRATKFQDKSKSLKNARDFKKQKAENIKKYGRVYGTKKNLMASASRRLNNAGRNLGTAVNGVERVGSGTKRGFNTIKRGVKGGFNTAKRGTTYLKENGVKSTTVKVGSTVYRGARNKVSKVGSTIEGNIKEVGYHAGKQAQSTKRAYDNARKHS